MCDVVPYGTQKRTEKIFSYAVRNPAELGFHHLMRRDCPRQSRIMCWVWEVSVRCSSHLIKKILRVMSSRVIIHHVETPCRLVLPLFLKHDVWWCWWRDEKILWRWWWCDHPNIVDDSRSIITYFIVRDKIFSSDDDVVMFILFIKYIFSRRKIKYS